MYPTQPSLALATTAGTLQPSHTRLIARSGGLEHIGALCCKLFGWGVVAVTVEKQTYSGVVNQKVATRSHTCSRIIIPTNGVNDATYSLSNTLRFPAVEIKV